MAHEKHGDLQDSEAPEADLVAQAPEVYEPILDGLQVRIEMTHFRDHC